MRATNFFVAAGITSRGVAEPVLFGGGAAA